MQQGDIIIVAYPFSSFLETKTRPAIIISNNNFHRGDNIIITPITTVINGPYRTRIFSEDLEEGELLRESSIHYSNVITVEKRLVFKKIAKVKSSAMGKIIEQVMNNFRTTQ